MSNNNSGLPAVEAGRRVDGERPEDQERALTPAAFGFNPKLLPQWTCAICDYRTPGTIDAPIDGDGTCPQHPRQALVPAGSSPSAS